MALPPKTPLLAAKLLVEELVAVSLLPWAVELAVAVAVAVVLLLLVMTCPR